MLSREDNAVLTRTGAGTAIAELFRRFWIPAMLPSGGS
jgi:phthalate 4,5-dioxygenase